MSRYLFGLLLAGMACLSSARADQAIFTDSLQNGWVSWGWASSLDYSNSNPVHSGSKSIAVTVETGSEAIYLHHSALDSTPYTHLTFWIHGGATGGQRLQVQAELNGAAQAAVPLQALAPNVWQQVTISLAALGVADRTNFDGVWIQDTTGGAQPVFYLDEISLITLAAVTLTSPVAGDVFSAPATVNLAASVSASGHTVNRVDFLSNGALIGSGVAPPYAWTWTNVSGGIYNLSARVTYDGVATTDSAAVSVMVATNSVIAIAVDAQMNRHPISPLIYGVAFASSNQLADLNAPLNRSGGNSETRYNWQLNAHNHGADWYFESIADASSLPGAAADDFIANSRNGRAAPMLTAPMIGWVPKLGPSRGKLSSYSIAKYGPQTGNDAQWLPDAGNGISSTNGNSPITWNDPNDANLPATSAFQAAWIQHLTNTWGSSGNGGVGYYLMDNEQSIWHSTHQDVHPVGATMMEIRDKFFDYAGMVKSLDPNALVLAPEEWGWSGYFYSGYDQQWSGARGDWNPAHFPDRNANGAMDYIPWLLDQFRRRATNTSQRLLDFCTVHVYPQGGEFGNDVSASMQLTRNRSTRQLWDANYVDPTWIGAAVKIIPRLKSWVATYYPGTKIGITEYNWGAESHINGATAQADIYGIFGRESLDLATRWTTPDPTTPTYKAMKMYRNYDGNNSGFGETSVLATGPNPDLVSVFAAVRSLDGALTVMLINKQAMANAQSAFSITNQLLSGVGQVWQLTAANVIRRLADISFGGNNFTITVPPQSVTLMVLSPAMTASVGLKAGTVNADGLFDLWLDGVAGQRYAVQSSSDLVNWLPIQTNTLNSNSWHLILPASNERTFYRAQRDP